MYDDDTDGLWGVTPELPADRTPAHIQQPATPRRKRSVEPRSLIVDYATHVHRLVSELTDHAPPDTDAMLDLRAAGVMGLCDAAQSWDPVRHGDDFWAYAEFYVKERIGDFLDAAHSGEIETSLPLA